MVVTFSYDLQSKQFIIKTHETFICVQINKIFRRKIYNLVIYVIV